MANSTPAKPGKPYPDYPLFPHATGRWAKKIRGKLVYFGPWDDPDAALQKYLDERDALYAGRRPRRKGDYLSVADACNAFLEAKDRKLQAGELSRRTWLEYKDCAERVIAAFGRERAVDDLGADDFGTLRATMARTRGPVSLAGEIQRVRCIFKYAYDAHLIDRPVRFGPEFVKPSKKVVRQARQSKAPKLFSAQEIRTMLQAATPPMKAMILLGINAGLGNGDCSGLPVRAIDFKAKMLDYPRPKTAVERRAPLWPETVTALKAVMASRPTPKDEADADLVFVTEWGHRWSRLNGETRIDSIGLEFGKLLNKLKIRRQHVGFYALRHTFETVAGRTGDQAAVDRIMGHEREDMATVYREWVKDASEDARLKKVTSYVRAWLFLSAKRTGKRTTTKAGKTHKRTKGKGKRPALRLVGNG